jgi:quercetin 2,3-dioxygenase
MQTIRNVKNIVSGTRSTDGDGVQLTRIIGSPPLEMLDPFLLLDAFGSDKPQDYIGGFPAHPHRGFQTVTYMNAGKMRHKDSAGNSGVIEAGGVQWMTAGRGIIHSEMPEQEHGLLSGFQLWVNLPASDKMTKPKYQERTKKQIPTEKRSDSLSLKVIAGLTNQGTSGVIEDSYVQPTYWDVEQSTGAIFEESLPAQHNAFIYLIDGEISIGTDATKLQKGHLAVLEHGTSVIVKSTGDSRYLLIAGKPLNEPVERAGPFVMNSRKEIEQAFSDYHAGTLAK